MVLALCLARTFFSRFFDQDLDRAGIYCAVWIMGPLLHPGVPGSTGHDDRLRPQPLFAWDCLEDSPSLQTIKDLLAALPDGKLLNSLRAVRGKGRSDEVHKLLSGEGITPLIQMRGLWQSEPERLLPGHDGSSNVVYTEDGSIYCYDKLSDPPVRHRMAYIGHEPERETLKYRCPAKHEDWDCPMATIGNAGKSYGKTVRVPRAVDLRRFPALPRATKKFERLDKGRTAVERVNARLKVFWGVDDGNVTGSRRFGAQVGVVLAVHAVFATLLARAPRREGTLGPVRLSPVAEALRAQTAAETAAV
jgi:hypothetical protein